MSFYSLFSCIGTHERDLSDGALRHLVANKSHSLKHAHKKKIISCVDRISSKSEFFFSSTATSILKKAKRSHRGNVTFDQVTVFFFPRCQGFTSVPSRGGCTLGMVQRHSALRKYTLAEFAVEQRLLRREKLLNRLREEKLEALKFKVSKHAEKSMTFSDHFIIQCDSVTVKKRFFDLSS